MLDRRQALANYSRFRNRPPLRQIVGGGFQRFGPGLAAHFMAQSILRLLRFAAAGWRVLAVMHARKEII
jgi:hypothetical protein